MNYKLVRKMVGKIMVLLALCMLLPLITSIIYKEGVRAYLSFAIPIGITLFIGIICTSVKPESNKFKVKEGFVIVALSWIIMSIFGALPLMISNIGIVDSIFEITSGFTTTGASVLTEVESLSKSIMLWRSFSHWIGGMGMIVFILGFLPESEEGSAVNILRAESPGPQVGKLVSKMKATSRILYLIYIALTLIEILLLWLGPDEGMDFFHSLIYSIGTAGTGGFSINNDGLASFLPYTQYVIAIFMIIFGINFTLYYLLLIGDVREVFRNEEIKWYLAILFSAIVLIGFNIYHIYNNFEETFRVTLFHTASVISTTGYGFVDFSEWPMFSKLIIVILMISGACAGSTSGGIKVTRVIILLKSAYFKLRNMLSPRRVQVIKVDHKPLSNDTMASVQSYIIFYLLTFLLCAILVSFDKFDSETTLSASLTCISNVGPGLSKMIGPCGNFSEFSDFSKIVLSIEMIAGRLELFPLIVLFSPNTWKRNKNNKKIIE